MQGCSIDNWMNPIATQNFNARFVPKFFTCWTTFFLQVTMNYMNLFCLLLGYCRWSIVHFLCSIHKILQSNSISNHPGHDTLASQILLIFSLFLNSVEMMNQWKFQPASIPYSSNVIEIWKFDQNDCSGVKSTILNLSFL